MLTTEEITPDSLELFVRLEPKIDILVMGVGDRKNIDAVRRRVAPYLREHKIALEISNTVELHYPSETDFALPGGRDSHFQLPERGTTLRGRGDVPAG